MSASSPASSPLRPAPHPPIAACVALALYPATSAPFLLRVPFGLAYGLDRVCTCCARRTCTHI
ncbi:MAG: hypothetical protein K8963_02410 [Proteobacteria bacterium]|nr:hypothetical protein [Pseudomonadota bacterium]